MPALQMHYGEGCCRVAYMDLVLASYRGRLRPAMVMAFPQGGVPDGCAPLVFLDFRDAGRKFQKIFKAEPPCDFVPFDDIIV